MDKYQESLILHAKVEAILKESTSKIIATNKEMYVLGMIYNLKDKSLKALIKYTNTFIKEKNKARLFCVKHSNRLVAIGFLTKETSSQDKRIKILQITKKGLESLGIFWKKYTTLFDQYIGGVKNA